MHLPDIEAKLKFLQAPATYGESGLHLECIETHMSWVFLAGEQVFKLKKPVCFPFLDFTTLKAREFYCREEVRLNARMAPGIYLGVVALQWCDGAFSLVPETRLPAPGETVDWLVLMRRLPFHRMLDHLIANQQVTPQDIDSLVERLGSFYQVAPAAPLAESDYLARFQCALASNREVLLRPQFKLENAALAIDRLGAALALASDLLRERVSHRRILDGHGDLRPEHVCLLQPPVVFDCLEFDPLLRQVDPFDEIAFLGMECDMAGAPWIGPQLVSGVARALGDHPHEALMYFYTAHRALLRARLAMAHLLDPKPRLPQKWPPLAERYIARALSETDDFIAAMRNGTPG
jgi:aminoglycoside phosphotransferase family enzyme